jgi:hypothetical protein
MTLEHRQWLMEQEIELQPRLASFVRSRKDNLGGDQSWSFYAYSFSRAFEVLWDAAFERRHNPILAPPLLLVCRHSAELAIKAALDELGTELTNIHDLEQLWKRLLSTLSDAGFSTDDEYSNSVSEIISILHGHDPKGDRFRYPTSTAGEVFPSTIVEFEELFRAHWRLTLYCEAIGDMLNEHR